MKKLVFSIFLLLICAVVQGQIENRLLLNFNAHRNDFSRPSGRQFKYHFWFPSFEFQRIKNKRILSFELAKFTQKTLGTNAEGAPTIFSDYKNKNTQGLIRFQIQKLGNILISDSIVAIRPYWGGAFTPHIANTKSEPLRSIYFPKEITSYGFTLHASAGIFLNFKRLFINANGLFGISQLEYVQSINKNPLIVPNEQQVNSTKFKLLPKDYLFRIGIGLKL